MNFIFFLIVNRIYISFYANKFYTLKKLLACSTIFNSFYFIFILDLDRHLGILRSFLREEERLSRWKIKR